MLYYHILDKNNFEVIDTKRPLEIAIELFRGELVPVQGIGLDKLVEMGKIEKPERMKIVNNEFVEMTDDELIEEGILTIEDYNESQRQKRMSEFSQFADPLFFKVQRGEALESEWLAKIEEIRQKYTYKN